MILFIFNFTENYFLLAKHAADYSSIIYLQMRYISAFFRHSDVQNIYTIGLEPKSRFVRPQSTREKTIIFPEYLFFDLSDVLMFLDGFLQKLNTYLKRYILYLIRCALTKRRKKKCIFILINMCIQSKSQNQNSHDDNCGIKIDYYVCND